MESTHENILSHIDKHYPGAVVASETAYDGILNVETTRERVQDFLLFLRDDEAMGYNFLTTLVGMHFPADPGRELGVVYHLHNWPQNRRLRVKVFFPIDDPHVPTASTVWPTANWMERQEYDFFGIEFTGHPDLRRILNVDEMTVFPMRKEYRMEDGTRTDKDDRFFGRDGHVGREFD